MGPGKKDEKEQVDSPSKAPGKKQMWALWTAVATMLGSTGIPKVIELLENKPSVEQVQQIVSDQTAKLTDKVNVLIEASKATAKKEAEDLETLKSQAQRAGGALDGVTSRLDFLQDLLRDCCTKRRVREKLETAAGVAVTVEPEPTRAAPKKRPKRPVEKLKAMPKFDIKKQIQMQRAE